MPRIRYSSVPSPRDPGLNATSRFQVMGHRNVSFHWFRPATMALGSVLWLAPMEGSSQEVGVLHAVARSSVAELSRPQGFGFFARVTPATNLSVRVSLYRQSDASVRTGRVCTQYIPVLGCAQEEVRTETDMGALWMTSGLRGRPLPRLELEGGGGLSLNRVRGEEQTASGRRSSLFIYNTLHLGAVAMVSGRVRPVLRVPLSLEAGLSHHQMWLSACAEEDWQYDPYCGSVGLRGAWIGIVFQPRW